MKPILKSMNRLLIVGTRQQHEHSENGPIPTIGEQWSTLSPRLAEIEGFHGISLGISCFSDVADSRCIDYVAGALVETMPESIPDGMQAAELAPQMYAVFTHQGPLSGLTATYGHIFHWLAANGEYMQVNAPSFEWYDERYTGFDHVDSSFDIYSPVQPTGAVQ
ncbi:GyrI-like domain-containing protein [Paenibacillus sp. YYML68]|uniref:GyrI-like domain-containing protein n=1 Tax=Paenibacillus sp. YYML68 TaxID=2909250 RepID=UPI0024934C01|nr:GyrI-like domain-containing protein [Paenibacillus sp. YYML68]